MNKFIIVVISAIITIPAFSQVKESDKDEINIKTIVEDTRDDSSLYAKRCRINASFIEMNDQESMVIIVENDDYIIPVRLLKNDMNALNRFHARNLQKGDVLTIEGKVQRIIVKERQYRGLVDAIIIDNEPEDVIKNHSSERKTEGSTNAHVKGRNVVGSLPRPSYNSQATGEVVVQVKVDQYGNVTEAIAGAEGTSVTDKTLWTAARNAALKANFNMDASAPAVQSGTITYIFKMK